MLDYYYQSEMRNIAKTATKGQFIAPTGTGKSRVQADIISDDIIANTGFSIYLVLTPRILLTNQLMESVAKPLLKKGIEFKRITVHSGTESEAGLTEEEIAIMSKAEINRYKSVLDFADSTSRASSDEIVADIKSAKKGNFPIVMCGTYHSVGKVTSAAWKANVKLNIVLCDEAQYVTQPTFHSSVLDIVAESHKAFYFTATRKVTASDDGRGMNNIAVYGNILAEYKPIKMIDEGYIVRPRLHFVDVIGDSSCVGEAVIESFVEHQKHVKGTAKMLVSCAGTEQLRSILANKKFIAYINSIKDSGKDIKVFDITSADGARIDGIEVERNDFLYQLRRYKGLAIVLHLHILTEGIDVPDMTGVVMLSDPKETKFFQTIGRTTRLDIDDRAKLEVGTISTENLDEWNKPYCYVITPVFSDEGADQRATIINLITKMRDYANDMKELILEIHSHGEVLDDDPDMIGDEDEKGKSMFSKLFEIYQYLEHMETLAEKQQTIENIFDDLV